MKKKMSSKDVVIILFLVSLVFVGLSVYSSVMYFTADTVTGEVTYFRSTRNNHYDVVEITYEYKGNTYTDGRRYPSTTKGLGSIVEFRVNPKNPEKTLIFKDVYSWYILAGFMVLFSVLYGKIVLSDSKYKKEDLPWEN